MMFVGGYLTIFVVTRFEQFVVVVVVVFVMMAVVAVDIVVDSDEESLGLSLCC